MGPLQPIGCPNRVDSALPHFVQAGSCWNSAHLAYAISVTMP